MALDGDFDRRFYFARRKFLDIFPPSAPQLSRYTDTPAMRTKLLQSFLSETSDINRYVTLALFLNTQFFVDHSEDLDRKPDSMTSEVFDKNEFRDQYNVSLEEVREDRNYYERFLFSTSFVFIYSAFRIYTEDLFIFTCDIIGKLEDRKGSELKSLLDEIGDGLKGEMGSEIVETLDYIRHLRNQHVHGTGETSDKMRNIKRRKGETLDKYWEDKLDGKLHGLDFNNLATETIDLWELIDYIRIIRRIAKKVDKKVIDILGRSQVISYVSSVFADKFQEEVKYLNEERIESKFEGFAAQELGITREEVRKSGVGIPGV